MMAAVVSAARDIVGVLWLGGAPNLRLSTARVPCRACGSDARQRLSTMQRSLHLGKRMPRSEEHTSELQSLMRISYAVFCLKKKIKIKIQTITYHFHTITNKSH